MQIPYFNAPIFLENKTQIGKVEEILGSINNVVSVDVDDVRMMVLIVTVMCECY